MKRTVKGNVMSEWISAVGFGAGLIAFVLGMSSIIMGFMSAKAGAEGMQEKIEYVSAFEARRNRLFSTPHTGRQRVFR